MGEHIKPFYANQGATLFDGVFVRGTILPGTLESATLYTKKLEDFEHDQELVEIQDNVEYRMMNPILSKLAASIFAGIKNIYVGPGSNVLYLPADDTCALTISYISDIVGEDGMVFVAGKKDTVEANNRLRLLDIRPNVQFIAVDNATHQDSAVALKNIIGNLSKKIDVLFCDVGHVDQVDFLFAYASVIMENESSFVAFLKANRTVHVNFSQNQAVVPNVSIFLSEKSRLEECRFIQLFNVVTIDSLVPGWCCAVGSINHA